MGILGGEGEIEKIGVQVNSDLRSGSLAVKVGSTLLGGVGDAIQRIFCVNTSRLFENTFICYFFLANQRQIEKYSTCSKLEGSIFGTWSAETPFLK